MTPTISQLADFVDDTTFADLPASVVAETKRLILDSIGCALAGATSDKGKWGLAYARTFFTGLPQATVIGFGDRMSAPGAAFVNAELINGLDYDPAGKHLPPFVIPASLAVAELKKLSGKALITACALAHEIGIRIGKGMSSYRDIVDGKTGFPHVTGHSCAIFGGTAGVAKLEKFSKDKLAQALSFAGLIAPMQIQANMVKSDRPSTAKYLLAGWVSQAAIAAAYLVKAGHRGDIANLDDDRGFWRYAGSASWNAEPVVAALGKEWLFPRATPCKLYPCCRIMHGALDCLAAVIAENSLRPHEIDGIHAYLEASCTEPVFSNRDIQLQVDAQFSVAYNLAVMAHGIRPGARWQEWDTLNNPEIRFLMDKVTFEPHPGYVDALKKDAEARISKVELRARGKKFVEERTYIRGTSSPDPTTYITDDELIEKFKDNASRILPPAKIDDACKRMMDIDSVGDIATIIKWLSL